MNIIIHYIIYLYSLYEIDNYEYINNEILKINNYEVPIHCDLYT